MTKNFDYVNISVGKNLFGDITEIYQGAICVAKYKYDAWGNCTVCNPNGTVNYDNTFIGNLNPFRYRGYYYDTESRLFTAGSRYYLSELRRFIQPENVLALNTSAISGLNLYSYANNNPINIAYNAFGGMVSSVGFIDSPTTNNITETNGRTSLPAVTWLAQNATTIYGTASSLVTGIPIFSHYYKYASIINDEFKLYGISKWKTSLQLSNVSFKMGALDGALIGVNVLFDMYDSYQRGVSTEGILLGGALTAASGVGMFYLNKGVMWATTTIGTAICPGIGTAIGFAIGLVGSILVDIFLGGWLDDWIDNNIK